MILSLGPVAPAPPLHEDLTSLVGAKRVNLVLGSIGFGYSCSSTLATVVRSFVFFKCSISGLAAVATFSRAAAAISMSKALPAMLQGT